MRLRPEWSWFPSDASGLTLAVAWLAMLALGLASASLSESVGWLLATLAVLGLLLVAAPFFQVANWILTAVILFMSAIQGSPLGILGTVIALAMAAVAGWPELRRSLLVPLPAGVAVVQEPVRPAGEEPAPQEVLVDPFRDREGLVVETIGGLRIRLDGVDVTASLLSHRLSAYLWIYLLIRRLGGSAGPLRRSTLAGEIVLDRPDAERLARLRRILHDLPRNLPPALAACLRVDAESVDFVPPDAAALDVEALRGLALRARSSGLEAPVVAVAEAWLRRWGAGEFLPELEVLEEDVVPRGPAGELVVALREEIRTLQGDLAVSVSEHRLSLRQPHSAIAILEPLAEEGRDDIDRLLIQACMEAGQTTRAVALRRRRPASMEV